MACLSIFSSILSFIPMLRKLYAHLSDPITVFSISGEFTGRSIPLSNDAHNARNAMQARIQMIPGNYGRQPDYEAEFLDGNVRSGIVTCAALSQDGKYVALGFGNGAVEITDIDYSCTISQFRCEPPSLPAWIEFIHGNCRIAVEDDKGGVTIFNSGTTLIKLNQLPTGTYPPVTMVSHDQSMIAKAPHRIEDSWYNDMRILYVLEDPSIRRLTPPTPIAPSPQRKQDEDVDQDDAALLRRRSIGFSPGGRYIGAFDIDHAFIWSTESQECIAHFHVPDFMTWMLNTCDDFVHFPHSYLIPTPVFERAYLSRDKSLKGSRGPDEDWLNHPFLDLTPSVVSKRRRNCSIYSSLVGKLPIIARTSDEWAPLWFNGQAELAIPAEYKPLIVSKSNNDKAWYGDRVLIDTFFLPRSSKDGTRILLQGKTRAPIIVDISNVV